MQGHVIGQRRRGAEVVCGGDGGGLKLNLKHGLRVWLFTHTNAVPSPLAPGNSYVEQLIAQLVCCHPV